MVLNSADQHTVSQRLKCKSGQQPPLTTSVDPRSTHHLIKFSGLTLIRPCLRSGVERALGCRSPSAEPLTNSGTQKRKPVHKADATRTSCCCVQCMTVQVYGAFGDAADVISLIW